MPLDFNSLVTSLWIGCICISVSLIRRPSSFVTALIFWCAVFPMIENLMRSVLQVFIQRNPSAIWFLALAAAAAYLIAVMIVTRRIVRHRRQSRHADRLPEGR